MTRIVFVHGMKNEGWEQPKLEARWHDALREGWDRAHIAVTKPYTVDLPYYGNKLHELTDGAPGAPGVRRRDAGDVGAEVGDFEQEYYKLLKDQLDISNEEVAAELPTGVRERGPANWEWVQAIARAVEKRSPKIAEMALKGVPQVDGYLNRPPVRRAVNDIVRPALNQGRTIVVAHSLGAIVTYILQKELSGQLDVPLYLTVGAPLGIEAVVRRVKPITVPQVLHSWVNAVDERDYVALVSRLQAPTYPASIRNITNLRNAGDDPHSISEYLKQKAVCELIAAALN